MLRRLTPGHFGTYFEPFVGSGCYFLDLNPRDAVLGDLNIELIKTYRAVRESPLHVAQLARQMPRTREGYYQVRESVANGRMQAAARFIYLNRLCYNGLYRTDRNGKFNVPYGSRTGEFPSDESFLAVARGLRKARLLSGDFVSTLSGARKGDFAYLDPPYFDERRKTYGEYGYGTFRPRDINRLIECLEDLESRRVQVLLSYRCDDAIVKALAGWSLAKITVTRNMSESGKSRTQNTEIIASNYCDIRSVSNEYKLGRGGIWVKSG